MLVLSNKESFVRGSIHFRRYRLERDRVLKIIYLLMTTLKILAIGLFCMMVYRLLWILETLSLFNLDRRSYADVNYVRDLQSRMMGSLKL